MQMSERHESVWMGKWGQGGLLIPHAKSMGVIGVKEEVVRNSMQFYLTSIGVLDVTNNHLMAPLCELQQPYDPISKR